MLLKKLLASYYNNVWNKRDYRLLPYIFADNSKVNYFNNFQDKCTIQTPEDIRKTIKTCVAVFPDIKVNIKNLICDEQYVAAYCQLTGKHTGEWMNFAPSGKLIDLDIFDIYKVEGGKIAEQWTQANVFEVLEQLLTSPKTPQYTI
jgi:steroid delta-isomerase-like uncharacterized protein